MRNKRLIILFCILLTFTALIVLSSAVFSVHSVYGYCMNADDEVLSDKVASSEINGIKIGSSIFLLSESKIKLGVESALPEVEVVNVERKFPDRVYVNYCKSSPCYAVEYSGGYVLASSKGKILALSDEGGDYIKITAKTAVQETVPGKYAFNPESNESGLINEFSSSIAKLQILDNASVEAKLALFESIDATKFVSDGGGSFTVKLRTGTVIEFIGGLTDVASEVRLAVSTYFEREDYYMNKKMKVYFNNNPNENRYVCTVKDM